MVFFVCPFLVGVGMLFIVLFRDFFRVQEFVYEDRGATSVV